MITEEALRQAATMLRRSRRPLLISHPRPDGDTIGSTLALRLALLALGKEPIVACVHPIPENFSFLPGADRYRRQVDESDGFDLVVAVDMSDLKRTGGLYRDHWRGTYPLLVIDHHETNQDFGDVNLVEPEAAATALVMERLIQTLGVPIRDDIATCLLTATLTDTRGMRTHSTTVEVMETVCRLVRAGGDYHTAVWEALDSRPLWMMKAWGVALNRLRVEDGLAWTSFPVEEKERFGISDEEDLDLGGLISKVREAKIAVSFNEMRDGTVKLSFRSRPQYNVATVAAALGGGGHRQAAGCSIEGPLEAAIARVLPLLRRLLDAS